MNLFERDEWGLFAQRGLKFFAIGEDVFARVPVGETKVEESFPIEFGNAAGCGAEPVDEPGEFFEDVELEDFQIAGRAEGPGLFDFCGGAGAWERFAGFAAR